MGLEQIQVDLLDWWPKEGGDRDIALAAWASSLSKERAEARSDEDVTRLVTQIVEFEHDTPKESVWFKYFLTVPLFVERQYDKYRMTVQSQDFEVIWYEAPFGRWGITQNELSGRYRTIPDRPYTFPQDIIQSINDACENDRGNAIADIYNSVLESEHVQYTQLLSIMPEEWRQSGNPNNKIYKRAREVLRGVLGTSYLTDMRIIMNLNAFEHIINQRLAPEAQMESRITAYKMLSIAVKQGVAEKAVATMIHKNGWGKWSLDVVDKIGIGHPALEV